MAALPYASTIEIRDTCLCLHAQRAARALARRFDAALRPFGLTNGQFSLLNALNRPDPAAMGPVADLLDMDRTTLTAALKPLERRGLVTSVADAADRRSRRLRLTESGRALLATAYPVWRDHHGAIEEFLPDSSDSSDSLRAALAALAAAAARPPAQAAA